MASTNPLANRRSTDLSRLTVQQHAVLLLHTLERPNEAGNRYNVVRQLQIVRSQGYPGNPFDILSMIPQRITAAPIATPTPTAGTPGTPTTPARRSRERGNPILVPSPPSSSNSSPRNAYSPLPPHQPHPAAGSPNRSIIYSSNARNILPPPESRMASSASPTPGPTQANPGFSSTILPPPPSSTTLPPASSISPTLRPSQTNNPIYNANPDPGPDWLAPTQNASGTWTHHPNLRDPSPTLAAALAASVGNVTLPPISDLPLPVLPITHIPTFPTLDQSQALINSLQNLRSTLHDRVESLGMEVDRLRRRAEELERGISTRQQTAAGQERRPLPVPEAPAGQRPRRLNDWGVPPFRTAAESDEPTPAEAEATERARSAAADMFPAALRPAAGSPGAGSGSSAGVNRVQNRRETVQSRVASVRAVADSLNLPGGQGAAAIAAESARMAGMRDGWNAAMSRRRAEAEAAAAAQAEARAQAQGPGQRRENSVEVMDGRKRGSGCCEIEGGDREERRNRRLQALESKRDPEQTPTALTSDSLPPSSQLPSTVPAASRNPRTHSWYPNPTRASPRPAASPVAGPGAASNPLAETAELSELQRLRNLLETSAAERRRSRAAYESTRDGGAPAPPDASLTSRGRRVEHTMALSNGPDGNSGPSQAGNVFAQMTEPQAAAVRQAQRAHARFTRYRDALLSQPTGAAASEAVNSPATGAVTAEADAIPPYPGLTRGPEEITPSGVPEIDSAMARRLAQRAASPATATSAEPGGRDQAAAQTRSEVVDDIMAAARTTEEINDLSRVVASLRERLSGVVSASERVHERASRASMLSTLNADLSAQRARRDARQTQNLSQPAGDQPLDREPSPRRPSYPFAHTSSHPHHRPRIGPDPIAAVINLDNHNSFDLNFDGNIIFRPIAVREPDRELIARCLSMLPGGRDDTPSRWMRLTGLGAQRPRRASATAGFWVRWVSEPDAEGSGLRQRSLDMANLPRIVAFDFAVSPPEDEAFVRADEVEFYTPRTRLRRHVGPWMHSRVRIAPFESDPPIARWGTSSHVRQAVQSRGGLAHGDFISLNLRARSIDITRSRPATSRGLPQQGLNPNVATLQPTSGTARGARPTVGTTDPATDPDAWLMAYEPAIGQIRAHWRAHYRRQHAGESHPSGASGPMVQQAQDPEDVPEVWSRDFLDADGMPLPSIALMPTGLSRASTSDGQDDVEMDGDGDVRMDEPDAMETDLLDRTMQIDYV